jgi:glycosyltransferase involved in cell wall biosynthesis
MNYIIVIPAYNEEAAIENIVKSSLKYSEVLVVDDGSSDRTSSLAKQAGGMVINHDKNRGKGAALKTGIEYALNKSYKAMVMLDGDGQHDPHFIPALVSELEDADLVVCSRFLRETPQDMAMQRRFSNKLTTGLLGIATGYPLTDSQCGFRIFNEKAGQIFRVIPYNDYEFESEMLYQASLHNLMFKEIGIPSSYKGEKSYITGVKIIKYIYYIFKLFLIDIKRRI